MSLYKACECGNLEQVKEILKDSRININETNKNGTTPFAIACDLKKLYKRCKHLLYNSLRTKCMYLIVDQIHTLKIK